MSPHKGFTLIELMVTVSIAAIVLTLAAPSFREFQVTSRLATMSSDFTSDLAVARSEAVRTNRTMIVCASSNGVQCGGDWKDGWIVGTDADKDQAIEGNPLRRRDALLADYKLESSTNSAYITFAPNGGVSASQTFTTCYSGKKGRSIALSTVGRPTVTTITCP